MLCQLYLKMQCTAVAAGLEAGVQDPLEYICVTWYYYSLYVLAFFFGDCLWKGLNTTFSYTTQSQFFVKFCCQLLLFAFLLKTLWLLINYTPDSGRRFSVVFC